MLARIPYTTTLPLAVVRANLSNLSDLVDEAVRTHERIEVTPQGRRAAVIPSDRELMREVRRAEAEAENGEIFSLEEVTAEMRAAGRLPR